MIGRVRPQGHAGPTGQRPHHGHIVSMDKPSIRGGVARHGALRRLGVPRSSLKAEAFSFG